jgi:hypothetical protein
MIEPTQKGFEEWCRKHHEKPTDYRAVWYYLCEIFDATNCRSAACCCQGLIDEKPGCGVYNREADRKTCWARNNDVATCVLIFDIVKKYVSNGKRFSEEPRKDRFEIVEGL